MYFCKVHASTNHKFALLCSIAGRFGSVAEMPQPIYRRVPRRKIDTSCNSKCPWHIQVLPKLSASPRLTCMQRSTNSWLGFSLLFWRVEYINPFLIEVTSGSKTPPQPPRISITNEPFAEITTIPNRKGSSCKSAPIRSTYLMNQSNKDGCLNSHLISTQNCLDR